MPMKGSGPGELHEVGRFPGGVSWIAHPDERMQRASHALVDDTSSGESESADVWVVDPVDAPGLDDLLAEFDEVAGVVVLLDRHRRDATVLARRHDVSVYLPSSMGGVAGEIDASVERFDETLADTGYRARTILDNRFWQETALYNPGAGTLVVPEAVGTAPYFLAGSERLGVHPMLRMTPPTRTLGDYSPERVLVGHGKPVLSGAGAALADALSGARSRAPRLYAETLRRLVAG